MLKYNLSKIQKIKKEVRSVHTSLKEEISKGSDSILNSVRLAEIKVNPGVIPEAQSTLT
jgi:hypothetical protein